MNFINYTPSQPEPDTVARLPDNFGSIRFTYTALPPKPSGPHPSPQFPNLPPAHPLTSCPTSVLPQTYPSHPLSNCPVSSDLSCVSYNAHSGGSQALATPLNDFDNAFMSGIAKDTVEMETVVDLTTDIPLQDDVTAPESQQYGRLTGSCVYSSKDLTLPI